ncbi:MAG TPA: hypothetical protein VHZ96_01310 [Frankiaceae bacterium]|jgi:hypothetical protein|nr:hypothetical protein [Frankiaceae bacterium]
MRNPTDAAILSSSAGRARIAHAIAEGTRRFLEGNALSLTAARLPADKDP